VTADIDIMTAACSVVTNNSLAIAAECSKDSDGLRGFDQRAKRDIAHGGSRGEAVHTRTHGGISRS